MSLLKDIKEILGGQNTPGPRISFNLVVPMGESVSEITETLESVPCWDIDFSAGKNRLGLTFKGRDISIVESVMERYNMKYAAAPKIEELNPSEAVSQSINQNVTPTPNDPKDATVGDVVTKPLVLTDKSDQGAKFSTDLPATQIPDHLIKKLGWWKTAYAEFNKKFPDIARPLVVGTTFVKFGDYSICIDVCSNNLSVSCFGRENEDRMFYDFVNLYLKTNNNYYAQPKQFSCPKKLAKYEKWIENLTRKLPNVAGEEEISFKQGFIKQVDDPTINKTPSITKPEEVKKIGIDYIKAAISLAMQYWNSTPDDMRIFNNKEDQNAYVVASEKLKSLLGISALNGMVEVEFEWNDDNMKTLEKEYNEQKPKDNIFDRLTKKEKTNA